LKQQTIYTICHLSSTKGQKSQIHTFLLQGTYFNVPPLKEQFKPKKVSSLSYWLSQGNTVSIGASAPSFKNGDLKSFIDAVLDATKPDALHGIVSAVYKNGMEHHGRY
jgi:hypothetical protein